jgi:hypothetical protein
MAKEHPLAASAMAAGMTAGLTFLLVRAMGSVIDDVVEALPSLRATGDEHYSTLTETAKAQDEHRQRGPHRRRPSGD